MTNPDGTLRERARVTQKDVAERAGVAVSVVSYVLNNAARPVAPETRARVLRAIDELGYRPNEHARRLIQQNWGTEQRPRQYGIILSDSQAMLSRSFYTSLLAGLMAEGARQNYSLRFMHMFEALHNPLIFNEAIHPESVAGVVVMDFQVGLERDRPLLQKLVERLGNVVCLDFQRPNLPSILFDQYAAGRLAARHLVELGHRRVAYVGLYDRRFEGYRDVLAEAGLALPPALVVRDSGQNSPDDGFTGTLQLLALPEPPTAIFCANDEVALGALSAARERNLRVPEDLSVVGVDDIELARYGSPPLTTVAVPKREMAALALRTLIGRLEQPDDLPINMVFPVKLTQRASTAPPTARA